MFLTILGIVLGAVGTAASIAIALWIYLRQRDAAAAARQEDADERKKRAALVEQQQAEQQKHEAGLRARDVRREKHKQDYKDIADLLDEVANLATQVRLGHFQTIETLRRQGVDPLWSRLSKYALRVSNLYGVLQKVEDDLDLIDSNPLPSDASVRLVDAVRAVSRQDEGARRLDESIPAARKALDAEWER